MTRDELLELLLVERFGPTQARKPATTRSRTSTVRAAADPLPVVVERRRALDDIPAHHAEEATA